MTRRSLRAIPALALLPALALASTAAHATNGYLAHGYGTKSKGAAGVGAALPQDALTIATNPAGLVAVGNRLDVGLEFFVPNRKAEIRGNMAPTPPGDDSYYNGNETELFLIPEFAWSSALSDNVAWGVAVFGNGGMNTDYDTNPYARFAMTPPGALQMNLEQLFIAPALAWQFSETHSLGLAVNLAYQRFEMSGLPDAFAGMSSDPANLTDNDIADSSGAGVRLGWIGKVSDNITLGASWQSKTYMSEFDDYAGLFADQGDFDIPENYTVGIAVKASDQTTIAIDWQEILYSEVPAVGNSSASLFSGSLLGSDDGPGFGWKNVRVVKIGAVWEASENVTLRGGFSHASQPVRDSETFINIIAPGVVQDHLSLGATFDIGEKGELSVQYTHAFSQSVNGDGSIPMAFGGGEANVRLTEDSLGVAWAMKY